MKRRLFAILLLFVMVLSISSVYAKAEGESIKVYLTLSKYGEIVKDKNEDFMAMSEVVLSGKPEYTIDDAFAVAHAEFYPEGADGYSSSETEQWGLGVDKLWGDTSGNFGYQVNGAEVMVMGPGHILSDGDHIDAYIYKNVYTENYSKFDAPQKEIYTGEPTEIMLYTSSYDENWSLVFSPCDNAVITIDGNETQYATDENGIVSLSFDEAGKKLISAKKEMLVNDANAPVITAPVCVINVKEKPENVIVHNIAREYLYSDLKDAGDNLPWIIADMAVYEELYPESEYIFSEDKKKEAIKEIVLKIKEEAKAGDFAKAILALRSLGYDAKNIYTEDFEKIDLVSKLTELVESKDESITNIYTLPYIIIALSEAEGYAKEEQMEWLISSAVESKDLWISTDFGTDAMTPMILALSPYYNTNAEVKSVIDEAESKLRTEQREDGLIDGFPGYESASTGLALCAFSSLGVNSSEVSNGEKSLIDGLMSTANESLSGFSNPFATEQGFRGLLAWELLKENRGKNMYDFSDYPLNEVNLSGINYCPVIFVTKPSDAKVTIKDETQISEKIFDLSEGTYRYSVTAKGYRESSEKIEITAEDVLNHTLKTIKVSLSEKSYSGGSGNSTSVKINKTEENKNEQTDKKEEITKKDEGISEEVSLEKVFSDVKTDDWYYNSVKYVYENNIFSGTDKGFEPDMNMTRAMLVTVLHRLANSEKVMEKSSFTDVSDNAWYIDSVNWAVKNSVISGMSEKEFAPNENITREQLAVCLYRFAESQKRDTKVSEETSLTSYEDFGEISEYAKNALSFAINKGLLKGKTASQIAPKDSATRAEVATILMRFAQMTR